MPDLAYLVEEKAKAEIIESQKLAAEKTAAYYPQLDGLRTIAIFLVVTGHWFPYGHFLKRYWNNGQLGVGLFFVLSGFLIGGILLKEKVKIDTGKTSVKAVLKKFYIRRALRIFPIYYLLLFFLLLINYPSFIHDIFPWLFFYASNFYMIFSDKPFWPLDHTWTLAVEEQFYLVMPFILLLVKRKYLLTSIIAFISIGIVSRAALYLMGHDAYKVFTFCKFDYFGCGILVAYFKLINVKIPKLNLIALVSFAAYCIISTSYLPFTGRHSFLNNFLPALPVFFAFVIHKAAVGFPGFFGRLLENKIMVYLGRISYGIYLYHTFMPVLSEQILIELNLPTFSLYPKVLLDAILVFLLSSLSFYIIENPINNLKRHFKY